MNLPPDLQKKYSAWFKARGWKSFGFQQQALEAYINGYSGIVNAPTGSGKTFSLWLPTLIEELLFRKSNKPEKGLKVLWITPLKALATDLHKAMMQSAEDLGLNWYVALRTGDSSPSERARQRKLTPDALITTPETLHILLASKDYHQYFKHLRTIIVDEWHELLGTKRGVQIELALSRLNTVSPNLKSWGISATIGNLEEAMYVLLGERIHEAKHTLIRSDVEKNIVMETLMPEEVEKFPWGGHLGISLIGQVIEVILKSETTLVFTNTRSQAEIWYHRLLDAYPDFAGQLGIHHGSLNMEIRTWVEQAIHEKRLKAVVCTSSLDLGVDFRPVDTVIQIGGSKGVARFMQRAGRSGHRPDATSRIFFVPTHSLELIEAAALRTAVVEHRIEKRLPLVRSFDVLVQYLVTLAVSDGFKSDEIFEEVAQTHAFNSITKDEWAFLLQLITTGGPSLVNYQEFSKVEVIEGIYKVTDRRTAMRHRMTIGTIVSDAVLQIKLVSGTYLGSIEEYFISRLNPGDVFSFAGRNLEFVGVKEMTALVRKTTKKKAIVPQWMGGKMNLSSQLSELIRHKLSELIRGSATDPELIKIKPLIQQQERVSKVPDETQFLIESLETREGHHLFFYTFEGRYVNEGLAALVAYRVSVSKRYTFSIAMTDYGFELLSDEKVPIEEALKEDLFSEENLILNIQGGLNTTEMARRKFRNIAHIAGLVFSGYPGKPMKTKHLQASSRLFFEVFRDYEPDNLLLRQAYEEVLFDQLDESRLRTAIRRINSQKVLLVNLSEPSPFCFPIMVERFREQMTTEKLEERVKKMLALVK